MVDAYQVFKTVYLQAVADGLPTAVATAAAQSAMDSALRVQTAQVIPAQPVVSVPGQRLADPGPATSGNLDATSRGGRLGG